MSVEWTDILPKRYAEADIDGLDPVFDRLRSWDWSSGRGPLLYGPKGIGKTYAACALARATDHPYFTGYLSLVRYFADQRRRMNGMDVQPVNLAGKRLVIIDDFGKERGSQWVTEQTFELIDGLYNDEVRVIVTMNGHPASLEHHIGEFAFDRLKEITTCVPCNGPSRRTAA